MSGMGVLYVATGGILNGLVSLLSLSKDNIPSQRPNPDNSIVRIAVALNGADNHPPPNDGPRQADGTTPAILAYNEIGGYVGWSDWRHRPHIKSGGYVDVVVDQHEGPGQQATYLQLFAGTDAVCIAYIAQMWADGQMRGWLGDMGGACGMPSYYSHIVVGNDGHVPDCMWLDADHSPPDGGHIPTAVQIHMQDFTNLTSDYSKDPAYYCEQECMIFHSGPHPELNFKKGAPHKHELFAGHPEGGSCCMDEGTTTMTETKKVEKEEKEKRQRVIKPRSRALANRLIASPRDQHLASKLCESKTSHGPDFVSLAERVFCDMGTKIHYPLCEEERLVDGIAVAVLVDGCYRWETHSLVTGGEHVARNYERIEEWE